MNVPTVREVMTRGTIAVRDDVLLAEAAQLLDKHHISGVPVGRCSLGSRCATS